MLSKWDFAIYFYFKKYVDLGVMQIEMSLTFEELYSIFTKSKDTSFT